MLKVLLPVAKPKRSKYSAKNHQCKVLGRLLNRDNILSVCFFIFKQDLEFREGYTLEKCQQSSSGSLIYSCYLLIGTLIIPMGIISCFYCCKQGVGKRTKVADPRLTTNKYWKKEEVQIIE